MKRYILILIILTINMTVALSQELQLNVYNQSLDKVLISLNTEISFDDKALSQFYVSVKKTFHSPQEAINFLIKDIPYKCEKIGNVFVISPQKDKVKSTEKADRIFNLLGIIEDCNNNERLPYAYITTDKGIIESAENGIFSINSASKSFKIQVHYLGYETLDTILQEGSHKLKLSPKTIIMNDVFVFPSPSSMMMQTGKTSGEIRLNHAITRYMPGSGDNSVFNLLRMMPGVRASGEPDEELIVWGSSNGESKMTFDGFTLFGLKSFSDHICFINPYMIKDVQLHKGGYKASLGNQIGAIADITGIDGDRSAPSLKANISNLTANIFGSVPLTKQSTLMVAYRQTFYNLYNVEKLDPFKGKHANEDKGNGDNKPNQNSNDIYIYPNYAFRDINIKYTGNISENDTYYASFYYANDDFDFSVSNNDKAQLNASQKNHQIGGAISYNKVWKNTSSTNISLSHSQLKSDNDHITKLKGNQAIPEIGTRINNKVKEVNVKLNHQFHLGERQYVEIGGEFTHYISYLNQAKKELTKPTLYITDNILLDKLSLEAGIRADIITNDKVYIQPRLSAKYKLSDNLLATASWGMYKQYLSQVPIWYNDDQLEFVWQVLNKSTTSSMHSIVGITYSNSGFLVSAEGYHKNNKNTVQILKKGNLTDVNITGGDLFIKKEFNKVSLFGSYSLINTSELQNKTGHELKLGSIISTSPFILSANYVYGTGLPSFQGNGHHNTTQTNKSYNRLDMSATYKLKLKSCKFQTGLSILNILGNKNIKYSYQIADKNNLTNVYTKAIPFTPMLFVEILF